MEYREHSPPAVLAPWVVAGAGYADQAHFTGDCRALAGVAPTALPAS
jgi:hypothetical protein